MKVVSRRIASFKGALIASLSAAMTMCVAAGPISAQTKRAELRIEVDLQPIDVQVKDRQGNDVAGLSANDFTVLENGKRQKIAFFDAGSGPVSLVVLVDSSDTMSSGAGLGSAQAIAAQFMRTARPEDDISAMDFTDRMGRFEHLTRTQLLNPSGFTLAPAGSAGSALYDAVAGALCHLRASKNPRQAVIVVTDGVDQHSRITLEQLLGLVGSSGAQLFLIGLQSRSEFNFGGHLEPQLTLVSGHDIDNPVVVFERLMKESGAESFIPKSQAGLKEALQAVSTMLQSEYTLAYYPEKRAKEGPRRIEVKVDRKGLRVLSRHLVDSAQEAAGSVHFDEASCTVSPSFHPYAYESKLSRGTSGLVYREDFSDPRSGWPNHKDSHYVPGGYEISNQPVEVGEVNQFVATGGSLTDSPTHEVGPAALPELRGSVVAAYGPWWSDFVASAKMNAAMAEPKREAGTKTASGIRPAAGLAFRLNPSGYYALLVSGGTDNKKLSVELVKRDFQGDSYAETTLIPWSTLVAQGSTSETNLSVQDMGSQISIFVDGQEVKSLRDDTYADGYVGFVVSGQGDATFRDLVVDQK
jgi:Ca-activated chloride channel homolog